MKCLWSLCWRQSGEMLMVIVLGQSGEMFMVIVLETKRFGCREMFMVIVLGQSALAVVKCLWSLYWDKVV